MKTNRIKRGFTLIEILIAVSILAVTLTAMASLVIVTIRVNTANMNSLQAYYLAEQGIEGMRNLRDSHWMQNFTWNYGFECDDLELTKFYMIDEYDSVNVFEVFDFGIFDSPPDFPWRISVTDVSSPSNKLYEVRDEGGYVKFIHDSTGDETIFSRYIQVSYEDCDKDIAEVDSVVIWGEKSLVLSTYLTNWQDK